MFQTRLATSLIKHGAALLVVAALFLCMLAEESVASGGFLSFPTLVSISAACRDTQTQWLVFLFCLFLFIAVRLLSVSLLSCSVYNRSDYGLIAMLAICAGGYFIDYENSARSVAPLSFVAAISIGRTIAVLVSTVFRQRIGSFFYFLLAGILALSLWQPPWAPKYLYRGQIRLVGLWGHPNSYGIVIAVGCILAFGLFANSKPMRESLFGSRHEGTPSESRRSRLCDTLRTLILICAFFTLAIALVRSLSRGAWIGASVAIAFYINTSTQSHSRHNCGIRWRILYIIFWLAVSAIILALLIGCGRSFAPVARLMSFFTRNDFSTANRLFAWRDIFS